MAKKKEKEIEVKVMGGSSMLAAPYDHKPSVTVEPIKNGYVIKSCCESGDKAEFTESLMKAPAIIKKLINVGNKSARQINEMVK